MSLESDSKTELVWRVVNTKCPVKEALIAICAVSFVLVSPTKIISGSCLRIALKPVS
jgi:hypothetical protein